MSTWAAQEREALVALFRTLGPDAPVGLGDWRTRDLAAHLYVRERRPDAAPGVVVGGPVAAYTERVMASALRVHGYDDIVHRVAAGPPLYLRPLDEVFNLFEFFVHHEDVRRANGDGPRQLPRELDDLLWQRLQKQGRLMFRRARDLRVQLSAGTRGSATWGSGDLVRVSGEPGELLLFAFNRKDVAAVDLSGDSRAVARLREAQLGP